MTVKDNVATLKSYHGKYLSADDKGNIVSKVDKVGPWETFTLFRNLNSISFKSVHGKFISVTAEKTLVNSKDTRNELETFLMTTATK